MRLALAALALLLAASSCGHVTTVRAGHRPVSMDLATAATTTTVHGPWSIDHSPTATQRASRSYARTRKTPAPQPVVAQDGWNLPPLLRRVGGCESSGWANGPLVWTAANRRSTASGAWQWLDSTWNRYRGYLRAMFAPPDVQVERAKSDFAAGKLSEWNQSRGCWA